MDNTSGKETKIALRYEEYAGRPFDGRTTYSCNTLLEDEFGGEFSDNEGFDDEKSHDDY